MIKYAGLSEDKKTINYTPTQEGTTPLSIKVYDSYTNGFIFNNDIDVTYGWNYYTYIPAAWKNRYVYIYNRNNGELLAPFVIDGSNSLENYDRESYLKKLFKVEKNESHQSGIHDVLREHLFDRQYRNIVDVEDGDVVVDIGFNYGIFSLGALNNGASKVYGFEPNKNIYNIVKDIYPDRENDKVVIYNCAVSDKNEVLTFYEGHNTLASSLENNVSDYKESYEVPCINFYDFILNNKIEKINFLKIDCEGAEYDIFENIPDDYFITIDKIHVEFHFNEGEKIKPLINKLERNGFDWWFEQDGSMLSDIGLIFAKKRTV
jgi:FkbM family methyltransferase